MASCFVGEEFASREACIHRLPDFFANGVEGSYESGIMTARSKNSNVVSDVEYI